MPCAGMSEPFVDARVDPVALNERRAFPSAWCRLAYHAWVTASVREAQATGRARDLEETQEPPLLHRESK